MPALRDPAPDLTVEGPSRELEFPDLEDALTPAVLADIEVRSPFQQSESLKIAFKPSEKSNESNLQRKINEL